MTILQGVKNRPAQGIGTALITLLLAFALAACLPIGGSSSESGTMPAAEEDSAETASDAAETDAAEADAAETDAAETAADGGAEATDAESELVARPDEVSEGAASELQPLERENMYDAPPEMLIDSSKYYYATFKTDKGDIKAQLFATRAPMTVNNFVFLAREGYYNDTSFHRVLADFMAQAGDPTGTGRGGPGYQFGDEFAPSLSFDRAGLLAMANAGPGTNGSQFFITLAPTDWLNNRHTIFGEVIEGMDVLSSLTLRDPNMQPDFEGDTLYTVLIEEQEQSVLPPPPPTSTPFAPSSLDSEPRPLATLEPAARANYFNLAPDTVIDTAKSYTATITTSQGELTVQLYDDEAPIAVNNFVLLANLGFYDNVPINQISPGQLVIFGSPDNNPASDAGYLLEAELAVPVDMAAGLLGYVPFEGPGSSSSQLILALVAPPVEANAEFSFFGQVTAGADLLPQLTGEDLIESILIEEE